MTTNFNSIIDEFNEKFNIYWENTIECLETEHPQLQQGSRLRPQICLWGYMASQENLSKCNIDRIANIAVSIELIHKATIIIDDWIDKDIERHGFNSYHFDNSPEEAVLLALNMVALSLKKIEDCVSDKIIMPQNYMLCLNLLIKTVRFLSKGALEELRLKNSLIFDKSKILEIIKYETAEIIGNSLLLGYYVGVDEAKQIIEMDQIASELKEIGDMFGYIFQTFNDMEAFINPQKLKEHKGTINMDFFVNRKNIVIATLYEIANVKDKKILEACDESQLLRLIKKYKVTDFLYTQSSIAFDNLLERIKKMQKLDISYEWIYNFITFMNIAKKYAIARLKKY